MIGTCHCGRVAFAVKAKPTVAFACNCSYCSRRGWHHAYADVAEFELLRGEEFLSLYRFGAGTTANYFCRVCGIHTHFYSTYDDRPHFAYSLACCDEADIAAVEIKQIDGKSF
jgi:hypothetical protein